LSVSSKPEVCYTSYSHLFIGVRYTCKDFITGNSHIILDILLSVIMGFGALHVSVVSRLLFCN